MDARHNLHVAALEGHNDALQSFKIALFGFTLHLRFLRVTLFWLFRFSWVALDVARMWFGWLFRLGWLGALIIARMFVGWLFRFFRLDWVALDIARMALDVARMWLSWLFRLFRLGLLSWAAPVSARMFVYRLFRFDWLGWAASVSTRMCFGWPGWPCWFGLAARWSRFIRWSSLRSLILLGGFAEVCVSIGAQQLLLLPLSLLKSLPRIDLDRLLRSVCIRPRVCPHPRISLL